MNATATLTRRESEIAELIAWGACKKEVANHLTRSTRTIENHVRNIYEKIGVTKVNELSAWWFCHTYSIPFDLSPIMRRAITTVFLLLFMVTFTQPQNIVLRCRRAEQSRSSRRTKESDNLILEI